MSDGMLFVLGIIFCVVVIPTWLKLHYAKNEKNSSSEHLSEDELEVLEKLKSTAESLKERVKNLEAILDSETPEWRKRYE